MNADCAFMIGHGHAVCQDYAAVFVDGEHGWAFLSDGCSGSPHTDIGARLLTRAAARLLPQGAKLTDALALAASCAADLALPPGTLDATLLWMEVGSQEFHVHCAGDGVVALQQRGGAWELHAVQYPTGCPDYASYTLSPSRRAAFDTQNAPKEVTTRHLSASGALTTHTTRLSTDTVETWTGRTADYSAAAVFSDGVQSFCPVNHDEHAPDWATVLRELLAFRTRRGGFVQRRMGAFRRECVRRGWRFQDDLSAAAVHWAEFDSP